MTVRPLIRLGARRSELARAQARWVAERLGELGARTAFVGITTSGDTDRRHLTTIGGTGVFATAVRDRLSAGEIDVAVHSLKDLPVAPASGLEIAAVPIREDVRDVLVGVAPEELSDGMRIGTGSPRRTVQLAHWARARGLELRIEPVRGNVGTRIDKVRAGEFDAVILAAAGLRRLGLLAGLAAYPLDVSLMLPAAGQAALACEIAADADPDVRAALCALDHLPTRLEVTAERAFLATLGAGCLAPVGVHAHATDGLDLTMRAVAGQMIPRTSPMPAATPLDVVEGSSPSGGPEAGESAVLRARALGDRLARDMLLGRPTDRPDA